MSDHDWAYRFISAYHLRKDDVEGFLTQKFGEVEFFIQVHGKYPLSYACAQG